MNKSSQSNLLSWVSAEPKPKKPKIDNLEIQSSNNLEEVEGQCNKLIIVSSDKLLDIGKYVNNNISDLSVKEQLLNNPWCPPKDYKFPVSGKRNLRFQRHWMDQYSWLTYSDLLNGVLCKYCVVFARECAGKGNHVKLGYLVLNSFSKWKNALEIFQSHSINLYHKKCVEFAEHFLSVQKGLQPTIIQQVNVGLKKQIEENKKKLRPIINTIIMMGRQEIAFRGTSDFGRLKPDDPEPSINDGNFRAILRMRVKSGDTELRNHIQNAPSNALYTSPEIQNEIISICGNLILEKIVSRINKSMCFSIMADETTDINNIEQLSLCIRYIDTSDNCNEFKIREDFLTFVPLIDLTGNGIALSILNSLQSMNINIELLCAQGYDGAASMSGHFNGVQAKIRDKYPKALYVHCSAHSLNLALSHSCQIQQFRNSIGTIHTICNFFKSSAQRTQILKQNILKYIPGTNKTTLISMCETRWVENHDALLRFIEIYYPVVCTLEELENHHNSDTSSKSSLLLNSIIKSEFVVSLIVAGDLFSFTLPLCKVLQKVNCDLYEACENIENMSNILIRKRENAIEEFSILFNKSKNMLKLINNDIAMPRINYRQTKRINIQTNNPEEYFRIAIYIPLLDDFIQQLNERFINKKELIISLQNVIPKFCVYKSYKDIKPCVDFYISNPNSTAVEAEFLLWQTKWTKILEKERPSNALNSLINCNVDFFPSIFYLLNVLGTLPVSTSTPERTFSTLKRLKTFLRNRTGQERLVGQALMSVHRNIEINVEEVIEKFSNTSRKMKL